MLHRVREAGINFLRHRRRPRRRRVGEILGTLISDCRDEVVLGSKVFNPTGPDVNARGLSRRHIIRGVEASLKRLRTDLAGLLLRPRLRRAHAIEQTVRALDDLHSKIRYPAVSNWAACQIATAVGI